jgi:hypothetical protein
LDGDLVQSSVVDTGVLVPILLFYKEDWCREGGLDVALGYHFGGEHSINPIIQDLGFFLA